jgi:arylsulfatase
MMKRTPLSRREYLAATLSGVAAMALKGRRAAAAQAKPAGAKGGGKPNFLIILADDMGFSDAGCYGGEIPTPNLDALADNGVRFTQCYSTGRCWPSRACILTGYYAQQVRMDPPRGRLPKWARVLPHYLKPLDYRCYHSGKWHLRNAPKAVRDGGFDHSYVLRDHDRFFSPKNHELDDRRLAPVKDGSDFYVTTAIADHALDFLKEHDEEHAEQPFALYLAFTSPHFPLHALQKDIERCRDDYADGWDIIRQRRLARQRETGIVDDGLSAREPEVIPPWNFSPEKLRKLIGPGEAPRAVAWDTLSETQQDFQATKMAIHAAMIHRMDIEVGRVIAQLKAMGAYENTVILFASDNGASAEQIIRGDMHDKSVPPGSARSYLCLGPGWSTASNTPFRLHKSWVHEGGISSPLIVHWPKGLAAKGELRRDPCHFIDFLPTVLDLAGGEAGDTWQGHDAPPLPGKSLVPALTKQGEVGHEFLYFHHMGNRALRVGDWKLVAAGAKAPWELYNLREDRIESNNLAEERPEKVKELARRWRELERKFRKQGGYKKK